MVKHNGYNDRDKSLILKFGVIHRGRFLPARTVPGRPCGMLRIRFAAYGIKNAELKEFDF